MNTLSGNPSDLPSPTGDLDPALLGESSNRILVVDDNEMVRGAVVRLLRRVLSDSGLEVIDTGDQAEAIDYIRNGVFAVLCDWNKGSAESLSGVDPEDEARINELTWLPVATHALFAADTHLTMMSGASGQISRYDGEMLEGIPILEKPLNLAKIRAYVAELLALRTA